MPLYSMKHFAAASALILLLTAGAKAETFQAVPNGAPSPAPATSTARLQTPKPRPASPGIPFAGLSLLAQGGVSLLYENQGGYGFGTANPLDTPQVSAVFHLKNDTAKPLTISRLDPSCHCTTATVEGALAGAALPTIAPGKMIAVRVTADLAGHPAGNLEKTVTIYLAGHTQPAAVLAMEGVLTPLVALTPSPLDFGSVAADKEKSLPITVTVDPRLLTGGRLPELRSSNSALRLVPQPTIIALAAASAGRAGAPKMVTRTYNAVLSAHAPLGPVNGTLSFAPPAQASSASAQAFGAETILLLGQVLGEVSAQPQSLSFGTVRQGQEATRQVSLMGDTPDAVRSVSVSSPSAFISAHLQPLSAVFGASSQVVTNARTIMVTLSRDAPAGTMQTQLKVSPASGRRLLIPLSAHVGTPVSYQAHDSHRREYRWLLLFAVYSGTGLLSIPVPIMLSILTEVETGPLTMRSRDLFRSGTCLGQESRAADRIKSRRLPLLILPLSILQADATLLAAATI